MSAGRDIAVGMGEMAVASRPGERLTMNLGSCVGVVLVDTVAKVAAALHAMLPESPQAVASGAPTRYVQEGTPLLVGAAVGAGAVRGRLRAKIVGGANMFPKLSRHAVAHLGQRNAEAARAALAAESIPLIAESVGGTTGLAVTVDAASGVVHIRRGDIRSSI